MISALLLANAGVSPDDIYTDYTASVRAMAATGPQAPQTSDRQASWTLAEVDRWLEDVEPFVRTFANSLEQSLSQLHIDVATRAQLRSLLTQP